MAGERVMSHVRRLIEGDDRIFYPTPKQMLARLEENPHRDEILLYLNDDGPKELVNWPLKGGGELTDIGILRHFIAGNIVIEPFRIEKLQSNGYDVSLGEHFFEFNSQTSSTSGHEYPSIQIEGERQPLFNPVDEQNVRDVYGTLGKAKTVKEYLDDMGEQTKRMIRSSSNVRFFRGFDLLDKVIIVGPHQMILGHTEEVIGGRNVIDTTISGKSTVGRAGIEVCSDANKGDVGFIYPWALEIVNRHNAAIILPVGDAVATITFFEVEAPSKSYGGRYRNEDWKPQNALPVWKR